MYLSSKSPSSEKRLSNNPTNFEKPFLQTGAQKASEESRIADIVAHSLSSTIYSSSTTSNSSCASSVFIANTLENVNHRLNKVLTSPSSREHGLKFVDDLLSIVKETKYVEQKDIAAAEAERQLQKLRDDAEKKRIEDEKTAAALRAQKEKEIEAARIQSDKEAVIDVEASVIATTTTTTNAKSETPATTVINEAQQALVVERLKGEVLITPAELVRNFHSTQVAALRRFGLDETHSTSKWICNNMKENPEWNFVFTIGKLSKMNATDEIKSLWTKIIAVNQWDSIATQVGSNQEALLQVLIDAHEQDEKEKLSKLNEKDNALLPCGDRAILVMDCIIACLIVSLRRHPQNFSPDEMESLDMTPVAVSTTLRYLMRIDKDPTRGHFRRRFRAFMYLAAPCLAGSQVSLGESTTLMLDVGAEDKETNLVRAVMLFGFVINPSVSVEQQRQQEDTGLSADPLGLYTVLDNPWTIISRILNALRGHVRSLLNQQKSSNKQPLGETSIWISLCCLQALILTSTDRLLQEIPGTVQKDSYYGNRMGGPSQRGLQLLRATHATLVALKGVSKTSSPYWPCLEDALGLLISNSQSNLSNPAFSLDGFNAKPKDSDDTTVLKPSTFWEGGRRGPFAAVAHSGDADAVAE